MGRGHQQGDGVRRAAALLALSLLAPALSPGAGEWVRLFDGRTLEGWQVRAQPADRGKGFWQVRDGAITCDSRGHKDHNYVWLVYGGEYGDFELRLKVRGYRASAGNSGVQFRSRYDDAAQWMNGPQIDIHPPAPWRTGLVYDETRETRRWIFPSLQDWRIGEEFAPKGWHWDADGWNAVRALVRGTRIQTWVNEVPAADFDGAGVLDDAAHRSHDVGMKGHIALQLHTGDELLIQYKDIQVRVPR